MTNATFNVQLPIYKSFTNDEGKMIVVGLASGPKLDGQGDIMTRPALDAFVRAVDNGITDRNGNWSYVPLRNKHGDEWDDTLGWITKAHVDDENNLWIEAELDEEDPTAVKLYKNLQRGSRPGKPLQLGFSVGGKITKFSKVVNSLSKRIERHIEAVLCEEISITSKPAYAESYVDLMLQKMQKSINWDDVPVTNEENDMSRIVTEEALAQSQPVVADTPVVADPPVVEEPVVEDAPVTEETPVEVTTETEVTVTEEAPVEGGDPVVADEVTPEGNTNHLATPSFEESDLAKSLVASIADLGTQIASLKADQDALSGRLSELTPAEPLTKSLINENIKESMTAAMLAFKQEFLDPTLEKVTSIESQVTTLAAMDFDKSLSVTEAEEVDDVQDFRKRLAAAGATGNNPISIALAESFQKTQRS